MLEDALDPLRHQADQPRKHAPFFSWYDRSPAGKGLAETGVVAALLEAMAESGIREFRNAQPSGEQWPDCWAETEDGTRIPFEVSELVDQSALPAGQPKRWSIQQIREHLQAIILRKDQRTQSGDDGPDGHTRSNGLTTRA